MLRFAGGRKTRFAQTVATFFPANLARFGGSQAHQRQMQRRFIAKVSIQLETIPPMRANRKCRPVFEPLKPIRRQGYLRKTTTKAASEFHFGNPMALRPRGLKARFFGYFFVARHKKVTRISQRSWRRNPFDFEFCLSESERQTHLLAKLAAKRNCLR